MNQNKVITCSASKVVIVYTDTQKHYAYNYDDKQIIKKIEKRRFSFNSEQQRVFRLALHGLSMYNFKNIQKLSFSEKRQIEVMHSKAVKVLNAWKQELADNIVDTFLLTLFPKSKLVKELTKPVNYVADNIYTADFKELGVNEYKIATKLVQENVLPQNFFNLC